MNIDNKSNELKYNKAYTSITSDGKNITKFASSISCEIMNHISYGYLFICFYENRGYNEISISIFNPENNFESISLPKLYINVSNQLIYIRTTVSKDKKNCLVCYLLSGGNRAFCFFIILIIIHILNLLNIQIIVNHTLFLLKLIIFIKLINFYFVVEILI